MAKKGKTWRPPPQSRSAQSRSGQSRPAQQEDGGTQTTRAGTVEPRTDRLPDGAETPVANRQARKEEARRQREALKRKAARRRVMSRVLGIAGGIVVVAGVVLAFLLLGGGAPKIPQSLKGIQTDTEPWPAEQANLQSRLNAIHIGFLGQEALAFHIHQHVDLYVNGQQVTVPQGIGFLPGGALAFIHTHATDGVIHVESPFAKNYTLGNFFDVWGVLFTKDCIGAYCETGNDKLWVFVNGKPFTGDPRSLVLKNFEEIVVAYGTKTQLPKPLPKTYGPFEQAKKAEREARQKAKASPTPSAATPSASPSA